MFVFAGIHIPFTESGAILGGQQSAGKRIATGATTSPSAFAREWPERARRRRIGRKAAAVEVLAQLPLDVVGQAGAMSGDEAPGLLLDMALVPALENCKKASQKAAPRARRRALLMKVSV